MERASCGTWSAFALALAGLGTLGIALAGPPPLVVDKSAPLLLDEPKAPPKTAAKPLAENESCFVCHGNYKEEPLTVRHAREKIGCVKCHGDSRAHREDEENITPPDVMFPLDELDKACQKCHKGHNAPAAKVIAQWQKSCPAKTDPAAIVCTDCHFQHRLHRRTVRWDRKTGALWTGKGDTTDSLPSDALRRAR